VATPRRRAGQLGLFAGPLLAALLFAVLPDSYLDAAGEVTPFTAAGRTTAALAVWMAVWWLTEAIDISATALLPLAVLPLTGATSMRTAAAPYAHELIFLFMGGFLLALAMQRWGLHRRIALRALRAVGDRPAAIVAACMGVTALLSMWVSNTATAVMMLPVACSVIDLVEGQTGDHSRHFALALLLGIAYSASIGGIATPIGTPPNLFLLSYLNESHGIEVSFVRWMGVALPLTAVFLPLTWWLLTRVLHPVGSRRIEGSRALVRQSLGQLGKLSRPERIVLCVFLSACALWMLRPVLGELTLFGLRPFTHLSDPAIAMGAALALFVAPAGEARGEKDEEQDFVLDWHTARELPWGILILFGGGLSLASALRANGVAELLGAQVAGLSAVPGPLLVLAVVAGVVFLTELTSNTATAATLVPLLAALAPGLGLDPLMLAVPAALAASCAFMLPVATPPNAIVFGSGRVTIADMSRAGLWLNLIGIVLITGLAYALVLPLLVRAPPG
jgi:sodium-dependent dicarboxylate transporter 2/3/5